jgi:uncharacterized protein (DUF924 family)
VTDEPAADHEYVLDFWFGDEPDDVQVGHRQAGLWWGKSTETDRLIWAKFEHRVRQAVAGELEHWLGDSGGRLAAIILIDQFSRSIYRDTSQAFAHDHLALHWAREGIAAGYDGSLRPIERVFFYMPLEHSESLEDQQHSVALFEGLLEEADTPAARTLFSGYLDFAIRHRDIIQHFGRFPHRNGILGRTSTEEELAFLRQPGSSF